MNATTTTIPQGESQLPQAENENQERKKQQRLAALVKAREAKKLKSAEKAKTGGLDIKPLTPSPGARDYPTLPQRAPKKATPPRKKKPNVHTSLTPKQPSGPSLPQRFLLGTGNIMYSGIMLAMAVMAPTIIASLQGSSSSVNSVSTAQGGSRAGPIGGSMYMGQSIFK